MSIKRIDLDVARFNQKIKEAVKKNFKNYISQTEKYKINGKTITIPVRRLEIPRFHYGSNESGVGQGEGDFGDAFQENENGNNHGDKSGEPVYDSEFTLDEIVKMLADDLELPELEPKNYGSVEDTRDKYKSISRHGPRSQRSFKRTMKETLKRTIASGEYDPENPIIIPEKPDFRHRYAPPIKTPETRAAVIYLMDSSGSMDSCIDVAKHTFFWIDLWIQKHYKQTERIYIHYDTGAREVAKDSFFKATSAGGTDLSSGLEVADKIISTKFNSSDWNIYLIHATDGDYQSQTKGDWDVKARLNKLLTKVNAYMVEQITGGQSYPLYYDNFLAKYFSDVFQKQMRVSSIKNEVENIPEVLKTFFGKVKVG